MTTNCLQRPRESYKDNVFTCGLVGWPGVTHIDNHDYSQAIERALELPGFSADTEGKTVLTGFGRNAVLVVADKVIDGVKSGVEGLFDSTLHGLYFRRFNNFFFEQLFAVYLI